MTSHESDDFWMTLVRCEVFRGDRKLVLVEASSDTSKRSRLSIQKRCDLDVGVAYLELISTKALSVHSASSVCQPSRYESLVSALPQPFDGGDRPTA